MQGNYHYGQAEKRNLTNRLILGIFSFILFMIGDRLLDMKFAGNVTTGIVESNWVPMSMWRFEASILLAAVAMPSYRVGIHAAKETQKQNHKTNRIVVLIEERKTK